MKPKTPSDLSQKTSAKVKGRLASNANLTLLRAAKPKRKTKDMSPRKDIKAGVKTR